MMTTRRGNSPGYLVVMGWMQLVLGVFGILIPFYPMAIWGVVAGAAFFVMAAVRRKKEAGGRET